MSLNSQPHVLENPLCAILETRVMDSGGHGSCVNGLATFLGRVCLAMWLDFAGHVVLLGWRSKNMASIQTLNPCFALGGLAWLWIGPFFGGLA